MDDQADSVDRSEPRLVSERRRVRRPPPLPFWLLSLALVAGLVLLTDTMARSDAERALRQAAYDTLRDAKLKDVKVQVTGLQVTGRVPAGRDKRAVVDRIEAVPGVATVEIENAYASKAQARACASLPRALDKATGKQRIPFSGSSPSPTTQGLGMLRDVARLLKSCPQAVVLVGGYSDSSTPKFATLSLRRAETMVGILAREGVRRERLLPRGYGDEFPVDRGTGSQAAAKNQRGSVKVQGSP